MSCCCSCTDEEQHLVSRVHEGVDCLAEHGRGACVDPRDRLEGRDGAVTHQRQDDWQGQGQRQGQGRSVRDVMSCMHMLYVENM